MQGSEGPTVQPGLASITIHRPITLKVPMLFFTSHPKGPCLMSGLNQPMNSEGKERLCLCIAGGEVEKWRWKVEGS